MKILDFLITFLLVFLCVDLAHAQELTRAKKTSLKATVIATSSFPLCFYHPCNLELIVRIEHGKEEPTTYAQMTVQYFPSYDSANKGFPSQLVDKCKKWEFQVVLDSNRNDAIQKYLRIVDADTGKDISDKAEQPAWRLLPGAENQKIPVGKVVPFYFVDSGNYKEIGPCGL